MYYVIGSGPAGISCAMALIKKGLQVTMLDFGFKLEEERQTVLDRIEKTSYQNWNINDVEFIKENMEAGSGGVSIKRIYGSDFPYKSENELLDISMKDVDLLPSLAQGGFSNVWGAAVLPYKMEDITDWPIKIEDLIPHYESVLSFLDLSAKKDDLENLFPIYKSKLDFIHPSLQAEYLYNDLEKNKDSLQSAGFRYGYSRLAVRALQNELSPGCVYCGLCMYGCPYRLIYSTTLTLNELKKNSNFHYIDNIFVYKITERQNNVKILSHSEESGNIIYEGEKVYLAGGTIPTTKILLESMEEFDHELTMKDSQYFIFPLIRYRKSGDVAKEKLHTLSQIFLELFDEQISNNTVHLQIYSYNDLYNKALKKMLKFGYNLLRFPIISILSRLLIVQGYLHSDYSSSIKVKLERTNNDFNNKLIISAEINNSTSYTIKKIMKKLNRNKKFLKAKTISSLLKIANPGKGFHSGGTFPMRTIPKKFESNILGTPYGFNNVHIVDSSVFPSIPATTITLSVMANAYRIATSSIK